MIYFTSRIYYESITNYYKKSCNSTDYRNLAYYKNQANYYRNIAEYYESFPYEAESIIEEFMIKNHRVYYRKIAEEHCNTREHTKQKEFIIGKL